MFNKESIDFLKTMSHISNSMVLNYPVTSGKTESADVAYKFDLSKFDTDGFEGQIGIFNLSAFLNIFSLCSDDRTVSINDNIITVSDDTTSVNYLTSATSILSQYEYGKEQFEKLLTFPSVLEMELTSEDLRKLKSASSALGELDTAVISASDEGVELSLTQIGKFKQSSNSFKIKKNASASKMFNIGIMLETLSKIPQANYKMVVKYNESKDAYRVILSTETLSIMVSTKAIV